MRLSVVTRVVKPRRSATARSSWSRSARQLWNTAVSTKTPPSCCWSGWRKRGDTPTSRRTFTPKCQEEAEQSGLQAAAAQTADAPARRTAAAALGSTSKSRKNSSNGTPSSIQSKSCWTGSRVPRKQGTPLMRAGSIQTASSNCMGALGVVLANVFISVAARAQTDVEEHTVGDVSDQSPVRAHNLSELWLARSVGVPDPDKVLVRRAAIQRRMRRRARVGLLAGNLVVVRA